MELIVEIGAAHLQHSSKSVIKQPFIYWLNNTYRQYRTEEHQWNHCQIINHYNFLVFKKPKLWRKAIAQDYPAEHRKLKYLLTGEHNWYQMINIICFDVLCLPNRENVFYYNYYYIVSILSAVLNKLRRHLRYIAQHSEDNKLSTDVGNLHLPQYYNRYSTVVFRNISSTIFHHR